MSALPNHLGRIPPRSATVAELVHLINRLDGREEVVIRPTDLLPPGTGAMMTSPFRLGFGWDDPRRVCYMRRGTWLRMVLAAEGVGL
jgi:hypothetical protein